MGCPRREVGEERLVGRQRLLGANPVDRLVGHVVHEMVAVFRGARGLDRSGVFIDAGVPLVGFAADEPVEVLHTVAGRGPGIEWPLGARLPRGNLVALAELGGREAVQLEDFGQRSAGIGSEGVVAGRGRGNLGNPAHAHGVVIAAAQESGSGGRAKRGRVESGVLQAAVRQPLGGGHVHRTAECGRCAESDIVEQDDEHIGSTSRGPERRDWREPGVGILGVVGNQPGIPLIGDRENRTGQRIGRYGHEPSSITSRQEMRSTTAKPVWLAPQPPQSSRYPMHRIHQNLLPALLTVATARESTQGQPDPVHSVVELPVGSRGER